MIYQIDLRVEKLLWDNFIIMFQNLPKNAPVCEIISLRKMNPNEIKDFELKKFRETILLNVEKNEDSLLLFSKSMQEKK